MMFLLNKLAANSSSPIPHYKLQGIARPLFNNSIQFSKI